MANIKELLEKERTSVDLANATLAVYDEQGINLKITEKNIDTIVKDAEKYIDPNYQLVEGLEEYLLDIIEEMEYNKE